MSDLSAWNVAAANNNAAAPDGAPEGLKLKQVNDVLREVMAAVARFYAELDASLVTGGTGNAYTLTTPNAHAALTDSALLVFRADRANTGAATLAVDGLTAKDLRKSGGAALASGDIVSGQIIATPYNPGAAYYEILNIVTVTAAQAGAEKLGVGRGWDSKTSNYTLVLTDAGKTIGMNNSSSRTITIPPNSSVAFEIPSYVNLAREGTGSVQILAGSGVTLRAPNGAFLNSQYSMATVQKKGTDEWYLAGDLKVS